MKKFLSGFLSVFFLAAMLIFALVLQYFNFLVVWQRYLIIGLFTILGFLALRGIKHRSNLTSVVSLCILLLVIAFDVTSSYYIYSFFSSYSRIFIGNNGGTEQITVDPKKSGQPGFNIYISGIDTFGPLKTQSRSDVNLICSVNPLTGKGLITTVPRDTYARIADGGKNKYDKLTHSGNYGVMSSLHTLENLFDIDIPYYVRVNFNSLIKIVDMIGGIEIDNPYAFKIKKGTRYAKGRIHLNGTDALDYARERNHLKDGELERGRHHVVIIKAIIQKLLTPSILTRAHSLLSILENYVETNMPAQVLTGLINQQLEKGTDWKLDSGQLGGKPKLGLKSYAMPGSKLYMYVPDQKSLMELSRQMKDIVSEKEE